MMILLNLFIDHWNWQFTSLQCQNKAIEPVHKYYFSDDSISSQKILFTVQYTWKHIFTKTCKGNIEIHQDESSYKVAVVQNFQNKKICAKCTG